MRIDNCILQTANSRHKAATVGRIFRVAYYKLRPSDSVELRVMNYLASSVAHPSSLIPHPLICQSAAEEDCISWKISLG